MRKKLGNLEGSYFKLQQVKTLLNLIENDYFDMNTVNKDDQEKVFKLIREYKTYQTLLFVSTDILYNEINNLKANIYGLYEELREQQDEKI